MSRTGRCFCGAVRFTAEGEPLWVAHCHCESCRRACSAGVATFVAVPRAGVVWSGAAPVAYASSKPVTRRFCGVCGAQMAYEHAELPDEVHLYLVAFDDPSGLAPERHDFHSERVPWLRLADDLARE